MRYLIFIILILFNGCRTDNPPPIEICTLDGYGAGMCVMPDGTRVRRLPSEMVNYFATNQEDMGSMISWCYNIPKEEVDAKAMELKRKYNLK